LKSFVNSVLILHALVDLALISGVSAQPPSAGLSERDQDSAIQPESIISGYPISPTYTISRYDEDYSFLANPANRTDSLDLIKYIPLFDWGPL
jgi:hypothetical protein